MYNWNTSVTGCKQGTVGSPKCKPLPRSTANTTASNKYFRYNFTEGAQLQNTSTNEIFTELLHVLKYVVGSKSLRPDIQKPRQMENAVRDI